SAGSTISAALVGGNGLQAVEIVNSGGVASATTINGSSMQVVSGLAVGTLIASGGLELVSSGGSTISAVLAGGNGLAAGELVYSGGVASATTVGGSGVQVVYGLAVGALIASGRLELVSSGGTTISAVLTGGNGLAAVEIVNSGGLASATTVGG